MSDDRSTQAGELLREAVARMESTVEVPDWPVVSSRALHRTRRRLFVVAGAAAAVVLGATLVLALTLGGSTPLVARTTQSAPGAKSAELTAFRVGERALATKGGSPVVSYGVIGPRALWVLNGSGLFLSTNDADSFLTITPPVGGSPATRILGVNFANASDGWVLTNPSEQPDLVVDRTTDGGTTWEQVQLPSVAPDGIGVTTMSFSNDRDGWVSVAAHTSSGVANVLLETSDGGTTWSVVNAHSPVLYVEFTGSATGWGLDQLSGHNTLYKSINGGIAWAPVALSVPQPSTSGVPPAALSVGLPSFFGSKGVTLVQSVDIGTERPWIAATHNAGLTWQFEQTPFFVTPCTFLTDCRGALPFAAANPTDWFYWSGLDLFSTKDAGQHWTKTLPNIAFSKEQAAPIAVSVQPSYALPMPAVQFSSSTSGWAIANSKGQALILRTRDGGRNFAAIHSPGGPNSPNIPGQPGITEPGSVVPG